MNKRKAMSYVRVGSTEVAEAFMSIDHQKQAIRRYCFENDIEIVNEYKDIGSANDANRQGLQSLINDLQTHNGKIDFVVVTEWSRLARNMGLALEIEGAFHVIGVAIKSIATLPDNPLNKEFSKLLSITKESTKSLPEHDSNKS